MLSTKLKEAAGNSADATLYVDDVFSTYLYTGNGSAQTITNGIDLAGKGGLVWFKSRNVGSNHYQVDTARGNTKYLASTSTTAQMTFTNALTGFTANGFNLGADTAAGDINGSGYVMASWTFREAPKFFDVVTWTGDGAANRAIPHNLGIQPGFVVCKSTGVGSWQVAHRGAGTQGFYGMNLNTTGLGYAWADYNTYITSTTFDPTQLAGSMNINGQVYVAYLFAHDTDADGIIQCGSFTTNGTVAGYDISLGWQPQYVMIKRSDDAGNWQIFDTMRGFDMSGQCYLFANLSSAESVNYPDTTRYPTATGFHYGGLGSSSGTSFIYMAIRMPNKPPTTGTQVYNAIARTGTGAAATVTGVGFPVDMGIYQIRGTAGYWNGVLDRLRGVTQQLVSSQTNAEVTRTGNIGVSSFAVMDGVNLIADDYGFSNENGKAYIEWNFKRAPGFFDEVCWSGNSTSNTAIYHNLAVTPELIIMKARNAPNEWNVHTNFGATTYIKTYLNFNWAGSTSTYGTGNTLFSAPTSSSFAVGAVNDSNETGYNYVAYLFATLAGISKVGSYTGNGTGQAIACGFGSGGARFVLIRRTDSTGNWYTFDSARGLTSGSSPYLLLNSTAAEVTGNNGVYASSGGFTLGATAITTTNIATATYIFLAVA
jgi:hypothetical protein